MKKTHKRRPYNTLGHRILAMLEIGGPRKRTVLRGVAGSEERLKPVLERLLDTGAIVMKHCRGGAVYALAKACT